MDSSKQYSLSLNAVKEEAKFLKYIGRTKWPDHMETMRTHLLQSTFFEKEIQSNTGNDHHVLESLRDILRRLDLDLVSKCDALLEKCTELNELNCESPSSTHAETIQRPVTLVL